jgi:limonene-1,2-epoxide hydrolase
MTPIDTVQAFLRALEQLDFEGAIELCADDMVYQNVPLPPARGKVAVARTLRSFERVMDRFEVRMHNIAANGPVVLTERTDVLAKGKYEIVIWVCGTFEVHDGKITLWRDYFDFAALTASAVLAVPRGLMRAFSRARF